jgi:hypothetical protein
MILKLFVSKSYAAFAQIVRRHLNFDLVAGQNSDVILAHTARNVGCDHVAVFQLHSEHGVGQRISHSAFHFNLIVFWHSRSRGFGGGNLAIVDLQLRALRVGRVRCCSFRFRHADVRQAPQPGFCPI